MTTTDAVAVSDQPHFPLATLQDQSDPLGPLLDCLRANGGFDFRPYQRAHILRRVQARMRQLDFHDLDAYTAYLVKKPRECEVLSHTIWINVTEFFRDPPVWDSLRTRLMPLLLARQMAEQRFCIWSAGCATGQEAYSLAILLSEMLGVESSSGQVRVIATDVDEEALVEARLGIYSDLAMASLPEELRTKYFSCRNGEWHICESLRRAVTFQQQNLLRGRIPRTFDLVVCRNTLMYFRPEAQWRVLGRLRAAMAVDGLLLLGRTDTADAYNSQCDPQARLCPADRTKRIYTR